MSQFVRDRQGTDTAKGSHAGGQGTKELELNPDLLNSIPGLKWSAMHQSGQKGDTAVLEE